MMVVRTALFAALFVACGTSSTSDGSVEPEPATPAAEKPHGPLPGASVYQLDPALVDQDGATVTLALHRGQPTIVGMFYASCPQACPRMIADLRAIEAGLSAETRAQLRVVLVSLDPERDGPELFQEVIRAHDLDTGRWSLVRAETVDVRAIAAALGIQYRTLDSGELHHETLLTLVDADGVPVARLEGLGRDSSAFTSAIEQAAGDSSD